MLPAEAGASIESRRRSLGEKALYRHSRFRLTRIAAVLAVILGCAPLLSLADGSAVAQQSPAIAQSSGPEAGAAACIVAPRPDSLWSLAQCCSRNLHSNRGCRAYDAADKYIILKDNSPAKPAAYLIIPTIRVPGIEDKQIFSPPVVDFWEYGWQQAQLLVSKPAANIGLAINSKLGRTQNQLHIHIACVLPAVARTLASQAAIGTDPATATTLALAPANHVYRVIKVNKLAGADSPFTLVSAMPDAAAHMADQSIAVIGSPTPDTYFVLDTWANGANPAFAEELLDQNCGS
jgi:CDP-diacylglycerol pyrophosphatase